MSDNKQISTTYNFCIKAKLVANISFALKDNHPSHVHAIPIRFVYKGYQIAIMYKIFATPHSFYHKRHVYPYDTLATSHSFYHKRHVYPYDTLATSHSFYYKRHLYPMIHSRHLIPFITNVTCTL